MLVRTSLILLLTALLLCLSSAFKTLIDVRSLTNIRSSSDDYEGFASSIMGSAAAIRQRISSRFIYISLDIDIHKCIHIPMYMYKHIYIYIDMYMDVHTNI
jgi:hypothetical protein